MGPAVVRVTKELADGHCIVAILVHLRGVVAIGLVVFAGPLVSTWTFVSAGPVEVAPVGGVGDGVGDVDGTNLDAGPRSVPLATSDPGSHR